MARSNRKGNRLTRWVKLHYTRLVRLNDPPHRIAKGVSLGVFLGIFPTFGLGLLLALLFSWIFKISKPAAVIGSLIMNPYTSLFFWAASYVLGAMLMGVSWSDAWATFESLNGSALSDGSLLHMDEAMKSTLHLLAKGVLLPYLLGNFIISAAGAFVSYSLTLRTVTAYRHAREKRLAHNREKHR